MKIKKLKLIIIIMIIIASPIVVGASSLYEVLDYPPINEVQNLLFQILGIGFLSSIVFINEMSKQREKDFLYRELREYEELNKKDLPKTKKGLSEMVMLAKLGEGFDLEGFKLHVFNTYKRIQKAWMEQDLESIRPLVTDTIFNLYRTEILALKEKKQKNIMKDIEYVGCQLLNVIDLEDKQELTVILNIKCKDYIVDSEGKVIYGKENLISNYRYRLRFIKNKILSKTDECLNCGAPLENMASDKCEYCNSIITRKISNYIMAEKKLLHQFTKRYKIKK